MARARGIPVRAITLFALGGVAQVEDVVVASIHWGSNWGYEVPATRLRRLRIERASEADALWLADALNREGRRLGTKVVLQDDGLLGLSWS